MGRPDAPSRKPDTVRFPSWLAWMGFALCTLPLLAGATTTGTLSGFDHASWTLERGAPGDIWDIVQRDDGSLLLATGSGLYRFDGHKFTHIDAPAGGAFPSHNMTTLHAGQDGDIWIGHFNAGISHLHGHQLDVYREPDGIPQMLIPRIEADASGRLWAADDDGLRWFDGRHWQPPPASMGYPGHRAQWLLLDHAGRLWVSTGSQLLFLPSGGKRFQNAAQPVSPYASLAESPSGEIWLADRKLGLRPVATATGVLPEATRRSRAIAALHASRVLFARDGSLWGSLLQGQGVFRVSFDDANHVERIGRFGANDGLTSPYPTPLLEDREGDIWVGTNLGLDRFRPTSVHRLAALPAGYDSRRQLYRAADGRLFAYGLDEQPVLLDRATPQRLSAGRASADDITSNESVWMALDQLLRWRAGKADTQASPPGTPTRPLRAVAYHHGEPAWACTGSHDVYRFDHGKWHTAKGLPPQACSAAALSADGQRVYLGYPDGTLRIVDRGGVVAQGTADGLNIGPISAIYPLPGALLVAGDDGLAVRRANGAFARIEGTAPDTFDGINGIALDGQEQFWLYGVHGLLRVAESALLSTGNLHQPLDDVRRFDASDGLPGIASQADPVPTLALGQDGLLWLASNQGIAWLDTRNIPRNTIAPTVVIGDIGFNGHHQPLHDGMELPKHTTQLQIDYAAALLGRPDRVRYRYRLIGLEDRWHEAGDLDRASYVNLTPGNYRFEVEAANEDGVWSTTPASRVFRIAPAFVQTAAFRVLCIVAALLAVALVIRLRTRQLNARLRLRLEERHRERERIARELHDTLLQGTQGLILRLHAASQRLPETTPLREDLETAMDLAERALAEGRGRVQGLRTTRDSDGELGETLLQLGASQHSGASSPDLRLLLEGEPRPLRACVSEELLLIGREAVTNALQHAEASLVEIEVGYARRQLTLRVRDDGRGMDEDASTQPGHYGISGMHERAERIGARLQVWSAAGAGTEVQVSLRAGRAYASGRKSRRWPWSSPPVAAPGDA